MTGRVLPFPPRRAHLYDPLVDHATVADIRRKLADEAPGLFTTKPTIGERLTDALTSPTGAAAYLGFLAGCLATTGLAFVWARIVL